MRQKYSIMVLRLLLSIMLVLGGGASDYHLPPGIKAGLYGDIASHSDFQVNLRPPEESTQDVESSLQALLKLEVSKARAAEAEASAKKQRMLNIEKARIQHIVKTAFEPLLAAMKS